MPEKQTAPRKAPKEIYRVEYHCVNTRPKSAAIKELILKEYRAGLAGTARAEEG